MQRPKTLSAFTNAEFAKAHELLATRVAFMMGRKFEEGDWQHVYCTAKTIPNRGWSNLRIDVIHNGLGIEHKSLRPAGNRSVRETFGMTLMHPSATRSIRVTDGPPNKIMRDVFRQYNAFLEQRKEYVQRSCPGFDPDMRTGWVLWQSNLKDFLYFEEEMLTPDPHDYVAEWHQNPARGGRKESKSLWIFEKETRRKRYSVTTTAGAKIQPYFDVPPSSDPNVYLFKVQGEEYKPGFVRLWIPASTARELEALAGSLQVEDLHHFITKTVSASKQAAEGSIYLAEEARPITLTTESYGLLEDYFSKAVSDAHLIQLLLANSSRP